MDGAEALLRTAISAGVEVCFANPGTTELPLVAALDRVPGMRAVLGLFEGVCTGAADGYGRMRDRPAMTLLHLGPGFANGIANLGRTTLLAISPNAAVQLAESGFQRILVAETPNSAAMVAAIRSYSAHTRQ